MYKGYRDCTPLLNAIRDGGFDADIDFYGSEIDAIEKYRKAFPDLNVTWHDKQARSRVREIQKGADFLFMALGAGPFEKGILTGKFYEYLEVGKPIIAICNEDTELAGLIAKFNLGIATRSVTRLREFIELHIEQGFPGVRLPDTLTREYQLSKFRDCLLKLHRTAPES